MPKKIKRPGRMPEETGGLPPILERAWTFLAESWRLVIIGLIVLGLIVVVVFVWRNHLKEREQHASFLLYQGITKLKEAEGLDGEQAAAAYDEALDVLTELVNEYGATESGPPGLLYRGKCLSRLDRYEEAIAQYEEFLSMDHKDPLYQSLALESLGFTYQNVKEYDKALTCFETLVQMDESFLEQESLLAQARIYEEMGEQEKALSVYKDFLTQYPDSPESSRIERRAALIESHVR